MRGKGLTLALALLAACGSTKSPGNDAGTQIDAGPAAAAGTGREIVSGSGRVTGGTMTMDVQIGHPVNQGKSAAGTQTIEGGAAIKP